MELFDSYGKRGNGKPCRVRDKIKIFKMKSLTENQTDIRTSYLVKKFIIGIL